jgi:uncharacterized PurR-regulated membrane protein YhhQ (DUF165 family)
MRVFKIENGVVPETGYRLNPGQDATWPPSERAYGGTADARWKAALRLGAAAVRLLVPVLLLLTLLLAVYLYADAVVVPRLPGLATASFTIADLVLPGCWTIIHLTNRRYGPTQSFIQLAAALGLAGLVALINPGDIDHWLPILPALSLRAVLAFFAAFAIANFVAIIAFDAARGKFWWSAPLAGSAIATFIFTGLYFPLAFGGIGADALAHFFLWLWEGAVLLLPFYLLRPAMRPLNGMNGF